MNVVRGEQIMKKGIVFSRIIPVILALCLVMTSLTGCGIGSQHLEVKYEENENEDINNWEDVDDNSVTTWDNALVVTWADIDEYSDWVYAELLFEEIPEDMPIVECRVLNYQSNGKYFDGEKVYQMVGDKFDVNSFVAKYAIGTGVIVICVVLNIVTAGVSTPVTCFIAGAADASVSMAIKGAAFGAATKAIIRAIKSGGDVEEALFRLSRFVAIRKRKGFHDTGLKSFLYRQVNDNSIGESRPHFSWEKLKAILSLKRRGARQH